MTTLFRDSVTREFELRNQAVFGIMLKEGAAHIGVSYGDQRGPKGGLSGSPEILGSLKGFLMCRRSAMLRQHAWICKKDCTKRWHRFHFKIPFEVSLFLTILCAEEETLYFG